MSVISEFEDRLNAILSDPEAMGQISLLASALQREPAQESTQATSSVQPEPQETTPQEPAATFSAYSDSSAGGDVFSLFAQMLRPAGTENEVETLLCALRPFLNEERRAAVDQVLRLLKLALLAQEAMNLLKGDDPLV